MIYPVLEYVHANLNTTFTDLYELIADLRSARFTGYVVINYWQFEALILFDSGQIIQSFYESENGKESGLNAYEVVLEKSQEKDGTINVAKLDTELLLLMAGIPYAARFDKTFSLDQSTLMKVQQLLEEKRYNAVLDCEDPDDELHISFYYSEGSLIGLAGKKENAQIIKSIDDISEVIRRVKQKPLSATIWQIDLNKTVDVFQDFSLQETLKSWPEYYTFIVKNIFEIFTKDEKKMELIKKFFLEVRTQMADEFNFLDPFLDIVTINNEGVTLNTFVNVYTFINGMDELISRVLERVENHKWKKIKDFQFAKIINEAYNVYEELNNKVNKEKRILSQNFMRMS